MCLIIITYNSPRPQSTATEQPWDLPARVHVNGHRGHPPRRRFKKGARKHHVFQKWKPNRWWFVKFSDETSCFPKMKTKRSGQIWSCQRKIMAKKPSQLTWKISICDNLKSWRYRDALPKQVKVRIFKKELMQSNFSMVITINNWM